jgi:hypothetical protein
MNLQPSYGEQITVQKEYLHSTANIVYKVGNVTLDGSKFTAGEFVKAGTAVTVGQVDNGVTNEKAVPYAVVGGTITVAGTPFIITNDVKIPENGQDVQVGALEEAYVKRAKVTGVTDEAQFLADSQNRYKFR